MRVSRRHVVVGGNAPAVVEQRVGRLVGVGKSGTDGRPIGTLVRLAPAAHRSPRRRHVVEVEAGVVARVRRRARRRGGRLGEVVSGGSGGGRELAPIVRIFRRPATRRERIIAGPPGDLEVHRLGLGIDAPTNVAMI